MSNTITINPTLAKFFDAIKSKTEILKDQGLSYTESVNSTNHKVITLVHKGFNVSFNATSVYFHTEEDSLCDIFIEPNIPLSLTFSTQFLKYRQRIGRQTNNHIGRIYNYKAIRQEVSSIYSAKNYVNNLFIDISDFIKDAETALRKRAEDERLAIEREQIIQNKTVDATLASMEIDIPSFKKSNTDVKTCGFRILYYPEENTYEHIIRNVKYLDTITNNKLSFKGISISVSSVRFQYENNGKLDLSEELVKSMLKKICKETFINEIVGDEGTFNFGAYDTVFITCETFEVSNIVTTLCNKLNEKVNELSNVIKSNMDA